MSLKTYLLLMGAAAFIAGIVFLNTKITLDGSAMSCGTAAAPNLSNARQQDDVNELGRTLQGGEHYFDVTNYGGDCQAKIDTRRAWSIPLTVAGAAVLLGALVVRRKPAASDAAEASNDRG